MQKREQVLCYHWLVADTGLYTEYWDYRLSRHSCYDDYYAWFNVELWADNTLIDVLQIMEFDFKNYFHDKRMRFPDHFYLPPIQYLAMDGLDTKEKVKDSFIWQICKMLTYQEFAKSPPDIPYDNLDNLLDLLNWEYLQDFSGYERIHKDYMWNELHDTHTN